MSQTLDPTITQKIEEIAQMPAIEILAVWEKAAEFLRVYRNCEAQLRALVIQRYGDAAKDTGTETFELANGYKLKIRKSLTYSISDGEEFEAIRSEIPDDMQKQLFKFKPELIKATYEKLTDLQKSALAPVVTIKPAATQIEIVAPKGKE